MTLAEAFAARKRIASYVRRTPFILSPWLSDVAGVPVSLKLESLQVSSSFKARGAFNAVIARLERGEVTSAGLVTASAGNHGRALAAAAETFGLPLVVFTPADTPQTKLAAIRRHLAVLRADGRDYDDAERRAKAFARDTGGVFISPYNDPDVIAGAATVAVEVFEDRPTTTSFVVPVGGGGLISGIAAIAKAVNPRCTVIGVEAAASCAFQTSIAAGRLVDIVPEPTLADGLGGNPDPETITFGFIQRFVDRIVTVSEADLSAAIAGLAKEEHLVAEGAGAAATAALIGRCVDLAGEDVEDVAVLLSGANIDLDRLTSALTRR